MRCGATAVVQEPSTERNWIGLRVPLHATASGKALLANYAHEDLDEVLRPEHLLGEERLGEFGSLLGVLYSFDLVHMLTFAKHHTF